MLNKVLLVSSPTCEEDKTQTSLIYLANALNAHGIEFQVLDLSGRIDYFDPPQELFSPCDSEYWLSPRVFHEATWLDEYLPDCSEQVDGVFYSALFSPDILVHGRQAVRQKKHYPNCVNVIGGAALFFLSQTQLAVLEQVFDYVCVGYDVGRLILEAISRMQNAFDDSDGDQIKTSSLQRSNPDYRLTEIKSFLTVYSGHGCNWGTCTFCNSSSISGIKYYARPGAEIVQDFEEISKVSPTIKDVMLSSESFAPNHLIELASCLRERRVRVPYNIMLRGEKWVTEELGESLRESGCTDVFIGAEALNDHILKTINKGLTTRGISTAIRNLSKNVKVIVGLILFLPMVTEIQLEDQLCAIEELLPRISSIEPEVLSVVNGSGFAHRPEKYGIKLWATERNINDSWCYGLSPDIPWSFYEDREAEIWFSFYDKLRAIIGDFVQPHYWDAIDHIRLRF